MIVVKVAKTHHKKTHKTLSSGYMGPVKGAIFSLMASGFRHPIVKPGCYMALHIYTVRRKHG